MTDVTLTPWKYRLYQKQTRRTKGTGVPYVTDYTDTDYYVLSDTSRRNLKVDRSYDKNWRTKVAKRQDASLAYFRSGGEERPGWFQLQAKYVYNNVQKDDTVLMNARQHVATPNPFPATDAALADIALQRLKRKIAQHQGNSALLAPTVELREMRSLIRSSALLSYSFFKQFTLITKLATDSRRLRKNYKAEPWHKHLADAWLTYSFAIKPLLMDIDNVNKSISEWLTRTDHFAKLVGVGKRYWWVPLSTTGTSMGTWMLESRSSWHHDLSYRYVAGLQFLVEACNNYSFRDHFGLTIPSVVPALWELKAFSWALDYFTTVGAYLDDTFSTDASSSKYCVLDRRYRATLYPNLWARVSDTQSWKETENRVIQPKINYWEFERTPYSSLPTPALRFRTQDELGKNALSKVLNLASVLVQQWGGPSLNLGKLRAKALLESYS